MLTSPEFATRRLLRGAPEREAAAEPPLSDRVRDPGRAGDEGDVRHGGADRPCAGSPRRADPFGRGKAELVLRWPRVWTEVEASSPFGQLAIASKHWTVPIDR
jgi:hypothetical protein